MTPSPLSRIENLWIGLPPPQRKSAIYGAVLAAGTVLDSKLLIGIGVGGLIGSLSDLWSEQTLTKNPELMNAYFKTQGKLSAVHGEKEARALKRAQRMGGDR